MAVDLNKIRRYELKYLVDEYTVNAIKEYIKPICTLDKHADKTTEGYTVNNLYLDTPDLRFYYDVKFRKLKRFKPRVRYYGDKPDDFLWLELKNKYSNVIWKKRKMIPVDDWPEVLFKPPEKHSEANIMGLPNSFEKVIQLYGAEPILHARYFRQPYVSDIEEYARITFDSLLRYRLARGSLSMECNDSDMIYYDDPMTTRSDDSLTILEIKTETFVPNWVLKLIRNFQLMQRGFSKYCYVLDACGELQLADRRQARRGSR